MPENTIPQSLTLDTYNDLLFESGDLHYNTHQGDTFGSYRAVAHTDSFTDIASGKPLETISHFSTEVLSCGFLLRTVMSSRDEEQRYLANRFTLLGTFGGAKMLEIETYSPEKRLEVLPPVTDMLLSRIALEGTPLTAAAANIWRQEIKLLREQQLPLYDNNDIPPKTRWMPTLKIRKHTQHV